MKISFLSTVLALAAISAAAPTDSALEAVMRREALLLERAGVNGNRPVAIGRCCVVATSLKQDVCTTASGATGVCLPLGASSNCNGAMSCVATDSVTCDQNVLENGRPKCR